MPHDYLCDCLECEQAWIIDKLARRLEESERDRLNLEMRFNNVLQNMDTMYKLLSAVTQPRPTWETMHESALHQLRTTSYAKGFDGRFTGAKGAKGASHT